jgi:hypothetical protein
VNMVNPKRRLSIGQLKRTALLLEYSETLRQMSSR